MSEPQNIAVNRKARHDYFIDETFEAGIVLTGIALAIPEDIAATVLKPLTRSQPVSVSGARDGKPQQWLYFNAGACPG